MPNQHTPKARRQPATVIKPIRWPPSQWREVQRAARAAGTTESEWIREQVQRALLPRETG